MQQPSRHLLSPDGNLRLGCLTVTVLLAFLVCAPIWSCPYCQPCYDLARYGANPGVSRQDAAKMRAWAESSPCHNCGHFHRVPLWKHIWTSTCSAY